MTFISFLSVTFVVIGMVFLAVSVFLNVRKNKDVPQDLQARWKVLNGLMGFFLAGYGCFLYLLVAHLLFSLELLTSVVFLGGAFFVFLVIQLSVETIGRINAANELLEDRIQRRTVQLSSANEKLEAEIAERKKVEARLTSSHEELADQHRKLEQAHNELKAAQSQILQREKMATIGQLAAGVAHEINNPIGFIASNLGTLTNYVAKLTDFSEVLSRLVGPAEQEALKALKGKLKIDYVLKDIRPLIAESLEGTERVRKIVQGLKTFSRMDEAELKPADINECLESTINIIWNELKYKATLKKDYGELPPVPCYPQQLNQVFMNLLVNASQALAEKGEITVRTWLEGGKVFVAVSDTGCGIPAENLPHLFEPFFTTKEVGKGTGLGLSIAYDIVKKHEGTITVDSVVEKGTTFTVALPARA